MRAEIKSWLANSLETTERNIENIIREEKATTYLWVWSIFEQEVFGGYVKNSDLNAKAAEISHVYDSLEIDDIVKKFHERYQDTGKFRNLKHNEKGKCIKEQLAKNFDDLTNEDKVYIALYVVYRYRNNIFHGNKGVLSWIRYSEQIEDCTNVMAKVIDATKGETK